MQRPFHKPGAAAPPDRTTQFVARTDGRTLAYAEFGALDGVPVLFMHGAPGCRLPIPVSAEVAHNLGLRFIAPDRPGYGRSDPMPGLTLLKWAGEMAALADRLGIEHFALVGNSGGACYAAACAARLSGRVTATALVGVPPPPNLPGAVAAMPPQYRLLRRIAVRAPWILRLGTGTLALAHRTQPQLYITLLSRIVDETDRRLLHDPDQRDWMVRRRSEAYRQGGQGQAQDLKLLLRGWGFGLDQMAGPVQVWQGSGDPLVPTQVMQQIVAAIPDASLGRLEEGGHLMLATPHHWEQVLAGLRDRIREPSARQ